jgi:hypothetical protein
MGPKGSPPATPAIRPLTARLTESPKRVLLRDEGLLFRGCVPKPKNIVRILDGLLVVDI